MDRNGRSSSRLWLRGHHMTMSALKTRLSGVGCHNVPEVNRASLFWGSQVEERRRFFHIMTTL